MIKILSELQQDLNDANEFNQKLQDPNIIKNPLLESQLQQLINQLENLQNKIKSYQDELDTFDNLKKLLSDTIGNVRITFDAIKADTSNNFSQLNLQTEINYINSSLDLIDNFKHSYHYINNIIKVAIDQKIELAEKKLLKFDQVTNKLQGIATEKIYADAKKTYFDRYRKLENLGYGTIGVSLVSTFICLWIYHCNNNLLYPLITFKITFSLIAIFLIAYFLKQATHYRKLADSAEQRHLELQAIPSYLSTVSDQAQDEIRKELALKYFGQPLDEKHYSTTESLIQDQIKSSTEVLKMTTSLLKSERSILNTASDNNQSSKPNDH